MGGGDMTRRVLTIGLTAVLLVLTPVAAQAHLVTTGLGPLYDGASHFALSPEEVFPVLVLALFAGLRGALHARLTFFLLPVAWLAGALVAQFAPAMTAGWQQILTAALFLGMGGLLASDLSVPPHVTVAAGVAFAAFRGAIDATSFRGAPHATLAVVGMAIAVPVLFALVASLTLPLKRLWVVIAVRVAGSWLAALGLLLVGWSVRMGMLRSP